MSEELKGELQSVKVRLLDSQDTSAFLQKELQIRDNILNDLISHAGITFEQENVSLEDVHRALVDVIQPLPDAATPTVAEAEIVE